MLHCTVRSMFIFVQRLTAELVKNIFYGENILADYEPKVLLTKY